MKKIFVDARMYDRENVNVREIRWCEAFRQSRRARVLSIERFTFID